MMKLPNKGGAKIEADLGDLDVILHFLVCFLRVSTSSARPNSDDGMFLRRILLVTHHHTFLYKKCHLAPFTSDAWGGPSGGLQHTTALILYFVMYRVCLYVMCF